ncbi:hypothetical protein F5144DRAFT_628835 [Chaetomium tenue]|uniref:Uncharacterized protein n=1 Tax=Chaetomium tenue TaxID=1854479 RepID=A0ACB7PCN4_9PEZI|nr:hypothetical protein F5144DRAFT_628835 [Chaetomium globosum]
MTSQQQQQPPPTPPTTTPSQPPQPPSPPPTPPEPERNPLLRPTAIALTILCPIALLLPTRGGGRAKSLVQNVVLASGGFWGVNQLATEYTGKALTARWGDRLGGVLGGRSVANGGGGVGGGDGKGEEVKVGVFDSLPTERAARNKMLIEAERKRRAEAEGREYVPRKAQAGLVERFWMGGEKEGWQEKRLEEERKAIESGKGYGELIAEQVREVWKGKGGGDGQGGGKGEGEGQGDGKGKKE